MKGTAIKKTKVPSVFSGVLPLFVLAHLAHHLVTALPTPLLPYIRNEFDLDYTSAGMVISSFNLSYGVSQLPAGWLADRMGPRILITISICGVAIAGFLVGISQTYIMLIVFLVVMGVLGGGYHPASPPLITASVEPGKRGQALGFHLMGGSASYFLAPLIAAGTAVAWGWRGSFIGLAIPTMLFGIVLYVLLQKRLKTANASARITGHDDIPIVPGHWRRLGLFIFLVSFTQAVIFSASSFIPLYLVDRLGFSNETSAAILSIIYSAGLWASPLGGWLSDRVGRMPVILVVCFLGGPAIYLLNIVQGMAGVVIVLIIIGVATYVRRPVTEAYILGQTPERQRSTVLGVYYLCSIEGGGIFTPVMGYLIDRFGFYSSFNMAAVALVVVTLACAPFLWSARD